MEVEGHVRDPRIVIIGGGISGVSAAKCLIQNGFTNVEILEAKDRLGGRICTEKYGAGVLDMGAQWIHGEHGNPIYDIAQQHHLLRDRDVADQWTANCTTERDSQLFYTQHGHQVEPQLAGSTCDLLDDIFLEANKFSRENIPPPIANDSMGTFARDAFYKYLNDADDADEVRRVKEGLFGWRCQMEKIENGCTSIDELSLHAWGEYLEFSGEEEVELANGYQPIFDLILAEVPRDCIKLNAEVRSVQWRPDESKYNRGYQGYHPQTRNQEPRVSIDSTTPSANLLTSDAACELGGLQSAIGVTTEDGREIVADHVIVTCSLGYLKVRAAGMFSPGLPQRKLDVIARMGFGVVDKIYLEFSAPFWDKSRQSIQLVWLPASGSELRLSCLSAHQQVEVDAKSPTWYRAIHGFHTLPNHPSVLCGWIAGEEARVMEQQSDDTVLHVCHELLQTFTGDNTIPPPTKITRSSWGEDKHMYGAYAYIRPGHTAADCDMLASPLPSADNPQVLFAGEATHHTCFATTHGALLSGQREAERLLRIYKNRNF